jgi:hypothetical protein
MDVDPYAGDALDLALHADGDEVFRVKTVLHNGALYIGLDYLQSDATLLSITGAHGRALPDHVAVITAQDLVVNIGALDKWLSLEVSARLPGGRVVTWQLAVHPQSGEVVALNDGAHARQHASLMRWALSTPPPPPGE